MTLELWELQKEWSKYSSEEKPESKPLPLSEHVAAMAISYYKFAEADKTVWFDNFRFESTQAE